MLNYETSPNSDPGIVKYNFPLLSLALDKDRLLELDFKFDTKGFTQDEIKDLAKMDSQSEINYQEYHYGQDGGIWGFVKTKEAENAERIVLSMSKDIGGTSTNNENIKITFDINDDGKYHIIGTNITDYKDHTGNKGVSIQLEPSSTFELIGYDTIPLGYYPPGSANHSPYSLHGAVHDGFHSNALPNPLDPK